MKVDDALREYAEIPLDSTVRITGNFDRIEIWEPVRHRAIEAVGDDELASPDRPASEYDHARTDTKEARGSTTTDRPHCDHSSPICSLPAHKMDSPYSARFRLVVPGRHPGDTRRPGGCRSANDAQHRRAIAWQ